MLRYSGKRPQTVTDCAAPFTPVQLVQLLITTTYLALPHAARMTTTSRRKVILFTNAIYPPALV